MRDGARDFIVVALAPHPLPPRNMLCSTFLPRLPGETLHDDLVEIVSTSHPALEQIRSQNQRVTWVQLRQYLAREPDASVSFIRDGKLYEYARADENPELVELPPLLRLFVVHREHDPEHRRCLW